MVTLSVLGRQLEVMHTEREKIRAQLGATVPMDGAALEKMDAANLRAILRRVMEIRDAAQSAPADGLQIRRKPGRPAES
jgi:hypothetical protein